MKNSDFEAQFLNYLNGTLSNEEKEALDEALGADSELKHRFEAFRLVFQTGEELAMKDYEAPLGFETRVMAHVQEHALRAQGVKGFLRRYFMNENALRRPVYTGVATLGICVLAILVLRTGEHDLSRGPTVEWTDESSASSIGHNSATERKEQMVGGIAVPELHEAYSDSVNPALPRVKPQAGNQTVTIENEHSSGVESYVDTGSEVDVVMTYQENGKVTSKIIAEGASVLAHREAGDKDFAGGRGKGSITLGVSPQDALKIETAKKIGSVSLMRKSQAGASRGSEASLSMADSSMAGGISGRQENIEGRVHIGKKRFDVGANGQLVEPPQFSEPGAPSSNGTLIALPDTGVQINQFARRYQEESMFQPPVVPGEHYDSWVENQRTRTSDNPISTFSIDVDTGSYTNVRRFLTSGQLPPKDAVRIEEMINYFDYEHPGSSQGPFTVSYEMAPSPFDHSRHLLKVGMRSKGASAQTQPWNLVFLIDTSGSMADPNKLSLVKRSLGLLVERMRPEDRISIVTYHDYAQTRLYATGVTSKQYILSVINSLSASGGTNGSAGLTEAYRVAQMGFIHGGVNRVVLTTDGDFNVGITDQDPLLRMIEQKRDAGITLTALGVGQGDYNEKTLEQVSNKGNGNYFYIDNFNEARRIFTEKLAGTMEVVAKDVKLQLEFNPAQVYEYRLIGYENRKIANPSDFHNDRVDAGELGSDHEVTALYELVLANSEESKRLAQQYRYQKPVKTPKLETNGDFAGEVGFVQIRYKNPNDNHSQHLSFPMQSKNVLAKGEQASADFRFAASVAAFGQLLRGSQFASGYALSDVIRVASGSLGEDTDGKRREFVDLVKNASSLQPLSQGR